MEEVTNQSDCISFIGDTRSAQSNVFNTVSITDTLQCMAHNVYVLVHECTNAKSVYINVYMYTHTQIINTSHTSLFSSSPKRAMQQWTRELQVIKSQQDRLEDMLYTILEHVQRECQWPASTFQYTNHTPFASPFLPILQKYTPCVTHNICTRVFPACPLRVHRVSPTCICKVAAGQYCKCTHVTRV